MKFVSRKPTKREAEAGAHRCGIKFAWRPISCDDGHTYWMRRVVIEQEAYMKPTRDYLGFPGPSEPCWRMRSKLPLYKKLPKALARAAKEDSE